MSLEQIPEKVLSPAEELCQELPLQLENRAISHTFYCGGTEVLDQQVHIGLCRPGERK